MHTCTRSRKKLRYERMKSLKRGAEFSKEKPKSLQRRRVEDSKASISKLPRENWSINLEFWNILLSLSYVFSAKLEKIHREVDASRKETIS